MDPLPHSVDPSLLFGRNSEPPPVAFFRDSSDDLVDELDIEDDDDDEISENIPSANGSAGSTRTKPKPSAERTPGKTLLPTSRVENIFHTQGEAGPISNEGLFVLSVATEEFIKLFAKTACEGANQERRSLVTYKDMAHVASSRDSFDFLQDTIPLPITLSAALARRAMKTDNIAIEIDVETSASTPASVSAAKSRHAVSKGKPRAKNVVNGKEKTHMNGHADSGNATSGAVRRGEPRRVKDSKGRWVEGAHGDQDSPMDGSRERSASPVPRPRRAAPSREIRERYLDRESNGFGHGPVPFTVRPRIPHPSQLTTSQSHANGVMSSSVSNLTPSASTSTSAHSLHDPQPETRTRSPPRRAPRLPRIDPIRDDVESSRHTHLRQIGFDEPPPPHAPIDRPVYPGDLPRAYSYHMQEHYPTRSPSPTVPPSASPPHRTQPPAQAPAPTPSSNHSTRENETETSKEPIPNPSVSTPLRNQVEDQAPKSMSGMGPDDSWRNGPPESEWRRNLRYMFPPPPVPESPSRWTESNSMRPFGGSMVQNPGRTIYSASARSGQAPFDSALERR